MPHLIDAEPLIDTFAETDPRMPQLVFALLSVYLEHGPFEFDASALAKRLDGHTLEPRLNPEVIASLQPDLERFFEADGTGLDPPRWCAGTRNAPAVIPRLRRSLP